MIAYYTSRLNYFKKEKREILFLTKKKKLLEIPFEF